MNGLLKFVGLAILVFWMWAIVHGTPPEPEKAIAGTIVIVGAAIVIAMPLPPDKKGDDK